MHGPEDLESLLSPESIAIVGASPDSWYTSRLIGNLTKHGFDGSVYPVNPSHDEVLERACYDQLSDVPKVVDLVVVSVPRNIVIDVIREAGDLGVDAAIIVTAGFSEADEEGKQLHAELEAVIDESDIRVAGPQCIGILNTHDRIACTAGIHKNPEPGSVGIVSQSGGFAFTTFDRATDHDIDTAYAIPTGNEVDLTVTDFVEYMADDPRVEVIFAYIEGLSDPRRFVRTAERATQEGTPIIAIKIGESDVAKAATLSHSGSVTGDDAGWSAAFERSGVEQVSDLPEVLNRLPTHVAYESPDSGRLCIVTSSGGYMSLLADMVNETDLELPPLPDAIERRLVEKDILAFDDLHNPVDIRGYGMEILPEIADVVFEADCYDAYVFAYELPGINEEDNPVGFEDANQVADDFLAIADRTSDPVFFLWSGHRRPDDYDAVEHPFPFERVQQETVLFQDAGPCIEAVESLFSFGRRRTELESRPSYATLVDDLRSRDLELPNNSVLPWDRVRELTAEYDIELVDAALATDADEAGEAADQFRYPVVMKVDSPDVPHRTDAGAVITDITSCDEARKAYTTIIDNVRDNVSDAEILGVLIQPQVQGGVEAFVGATRDNLFGPLLTVGTGGINVEQYDDATTRLAPLSAQEADAAIAETRLDGLLANSHDGSPKDVASLSELLVNVSRLMAEVDAIAELDLNPVIVREDEIAVVDALVRTQ